MVLLVSAEAADAIHKEAHGLGADEDSAGDGQTGHGRSKPSGYFPDSLSRNCLENSNRLHSSVSRDGETRREVSLLPLLRHQKHAI
jgi:hypothetical protein